MHAGKQDEQFGDLIVPLRLSTTFVQPEPGKHKGFEYARAGNPTRAELERRIAALENGQFCLAFASGQAAAATVMLSLLKAGDRVICAEDVYEGTLRLLGVMKLLGIESDVVNIDDDREVRAGMRKNTRMIWIETPSNPLLKEHRIKALTQLARTRGALLVVDNTLATPVFQQPLAEGADIVVHSITKFMAGHNDVTAGAVVLNNKKLHEQIKRLQHTLGAVPSPFDCFLTLRGIKTLHLRMEAHRKSATEIAGFLQQQPKIERVAFPDTSGIVSFWVKGGLQTTRRFLKNLKLIKIADSYGGAESVVQHPVTMLNLTLPAKARERMGLTSNLVRLSVGLEDVDDIIEDLSQAFKKI